MARTLGLNFEQRQAYSRLTRGQAIVKLAGRFTEPFLIQTEYRAINKEVSQSQIKASYEPMMQKYAASIRTYQPENKQETQKASQTPLDALLWGIFHEPYVFVSRRYEMLGLAPKIGNELKKKSVLEGYVRQVQLQTKRRGRLAVFLDLLEKGYRRIGQTPKPRLTNGGFEHSYWAWILSEDFRKIPGCVVKTEVALASNPSKRFDLVTYQSGHVTGYEIETNPRATLANNFSKDADMDELVIAVTRTDLVKEAQKIALEHFNGLLPCWLRIAYAGDLI